MSGGNSKTKWDLGGRPTEGQRKLGLVLSGFLTLLFSLLAVVSVWSYFTSTLPIWFAVSTVLVTVLCGVIFWRSLFSTPRALSARAIRIACILFIVGGLGLLIAAVAIDQPLQESLFAAALGLTSIGCGIQNLGRSRRSDGGPAA